MATGTTTSTARAPTPPLPIFARSPVSTPVRTMIHDTRIATSVPHSSSQWPPCV